jgi:hypothetical protein
MPSSSSTHIVHSFAELLSTPFAGEVNALCWPRALSGDFTEVIAKLPVRPGIAALEDDEMLALELSAAGQQARDAMLGDLRLLREHGLLPELNTIHGHVRDPIDGAISTEVYSWHVDSATIPADTWLCTYHGACSEGLRNDQARRRVDVPETRAALLAEFGGEDDADFAEWLNDCCYDLHYTPLAGAVPFAFGLHALWRVATLHDGSPTLPCIHRAPETLPGVVPRLLLIS